MITIVTEDNDCRSWSCSRSRPNSNLNQFFQSWQNSLYLIQDMGLSIRQWIDIPGPLCEIGKCAYYVTSHPLLRYRVVPLLIGPKWWWILEALIHGIPMPGPLQRIYGGWRAVWWHPLHWPDSVGNIFFFIISTTSTGWISLPPQGKTYIVYTLEFGGGVVSVPCSGCFCLYVDSIMVTGVSLLTYVDLCFQLTTIRNMKTEFEPILNSK